MAKITKTKAASASGPIGRPGTLKKKKSLKLRSLRKKRETVKSTKYIHVHRYLDTGRWGAWYSCPMGTRRRLYFGCHLTENLAARAQDRALLKFKPLAKKKIILNFKEEDYASDEKLRATLTNHEFTDLLASEARPCYKRVEATECLKKFMAEEKALGNLPIESEKDGRYKKVEPVRDYVERVIKNRPTVPSTLTWIGRRARTTVTYYDD